MAYMFMAETKTSIADPFWCEASQILLQSIIAYIMDNYDEEERTIHELLSLIEKCKVDENYSSESTELDVLINVERKYNPNAFSVSQYDKFRVAAGKTLKSIMISVNAKLASYDIPEIRELTKCDDLEIRKIGLEKTALFVTVSDNDRSLDGLVNMFFTQIMSELCSFADKKCNGQLPVPVRFIMDDFATNCKIYDFPRMISSIRSRNISTMIIIQAESQLFSCYGDDGRTILGNCDTYLYLGCNDVDTAKEISRRANMPLDKILYMPIGTNWLFRRGQRPINGKNINLERYLTELNILKEAR